MATQKQDHGLVVLLGTTAMHGWLAASLLACEHRRQEGQLGFKEMYLFQVQHWECRREGDGQRKQEAT